jgi:hypothetical protein
MTEFIFFVRLKEWLSSQANQSTWLIRLVRLLLPTGMCDNPAWHWLPFGSPTSDVMSGFVINSLSLPIAS